MTRIPAGWDAERRGEDKIPSPERRIPKTPSQNDRSEFVRTSTLQKEGTGECAS